MRAANSRTSRRARDPTSQWRAPIAGIGVGDFDGDGRLDVVITVLGDRPQLLHNVSSPDNNWLTLRLIGRASNRQGIGTVIHWARRPIR